MECFLSEAKTLAEFIGNENIVRIHSYFEENGTAYFVMEYVEGKSFQTYLKECGGKIGWEEAGRILFPIMDALGAVHAKGIIHRDVTPDNIFLTEGGGVKLLDFGAARYSLGDRSRSLDVVLKHGYAPKEQYTRRGRQGAYTDVYSVAACFYFAVTGHKPPDSIERMDEDDLIPPSSLGVKVDEAREDALLKGLSVQAADRYQNMADFKAAMTAGEETGPEMDSLESAAASLKPVTANLGSTGNVTEPAKEKSESAPDVVVAGSGAMPEGSQTVGKYHEGTESQKERGSSDTPKVEGKLLEIVTRLREKKLVVPVTVAVVALVVVVASVVIRVQSSHKKPAQNEDSVLVDANPGAVTSKVEAQTSETETDISVAGASDVTVESEGDVVYRIAKQTEHMPSEGTIYCFEYTYDQKGNELTASWYYEKGYSDTGSSETTYDSAGNILTERIYYNNKIDYEYKYSYDNKGNLLTYIEDYNGNHYEYHYTYDATGNKLTETDYNEDGIIFWSDFSYNADGTEVTETTYDADDGTVFSWKEYTYDKRGNLLKYLDYSSLFSDSIRLDEQRESIYDTSDNLLVLMKTHYDDDGETIISSHREEYTYDESNNILTYEESSLAYDGSTDQKKEIYSYEFDEYGNVLKKTTYNGQADDNHITKIEEYEYIAIAVQKEE